MGMEGADLERWVERRAQFLSSHDIGLSRREAEAVAYHEQGFSASGTAQRMDVGESTVKKYKRNASEQHPGILIRMAYEFDYDPEAGVENLPGALDRTCPFCEKDRLCTPDGAQRVFQTSGWGATSMLEDADRVCSYCRAVQIDGEWDRMQTVESRAYELAQASGSKGVSEYRAILTAAEPEQDKPTVDTDEW